MSHWAELDENNVVTRVIVGDNNLPGEGYDWIVKNLGGTWAKTSFNTRGGIYYTPNTDTPDKDQSKAFRGNYARIGYVYDGANDVFYSPQPFPSWVLNTATWDWEPPIPYPDFLLSAELENEETINPVYNWDETTQSWTLSTW